MKNPSIPVLSLEASVADMLAALRQYPKEQRPLGRLGQLNKRLRRTRSYLNEISARSHC